MRGGLLRRAGTILCAVSVLTVCNIAPVSAATAAPTLSARVRRGLRGLRAQPCPARRRHRRGLGLQSNEPAGQRHHHHVECAVAGVRARRDGMPARLARELVPPRSQGNRGRRVLQYGVARRQHAHVVGSSRRRFARFARHRQDARQRVQRGVPNRSGSGLCGRGHVVPARVTSRFVLARGDGDRGRHLLRARRAQRQQRRVVGVQHVGAVGEREREGARGATGSRVRGRREIVSGRFDSRQFPRAGSARYRVAIRSAWRCKVTRRWRGGRTDTANSATAP